MDHALPDAGFLQRKHLLARAHDGKHIADIICLFHVDHIALAALHDLTAQIDKGIDQLFQIVCHVL